MWGVRQIRYDGLEVFGKCGKGAKIIDVCKELQGGHHRRNMRADDGRKLLKDADDFPFLGSLHLADAVVGIHHLGGLYEDGLSRCALVVDDTLDLSLQRRCHGYHQSSVAHGGTDVAVDITFLLCCADDGAQGMADAARGHLDAVTDGEQFGRGGILDLTVFVQHSVNASYDVREAFHPFGHAEEGGIGGGVVRRIGGGMRRFIAGIVCCGALSQEFHQAEHRLQGAFEVEKVELLHVCPLGTDAHKRLPHIVEVLFVDIFFRLHEAHEIICLRQRFGDSFEVVGKLYMVVHPFRAQCRHTTPLQQGTDVGEP